MRSLSASAQTAEARALAAWPLAVYLRRACAPVASRAAPPSRAAWPEMACLAAASGGAVALCDERAALRRRRGRGARLPARARGAHARAGVASDAHACDYAVVGASGRVGRLCVERLRALEPEARVRCLVRDAASAQARALEQLGVQLVAGDLTEPRARAELLEGGARCVISTAGTVGRYRKLGDVLGDPATAPPCEDTSHPYKVNFVTQGALASEAAAAGAVRFVRVTGLTAGRGAFSLFTNIFNIVGCGTVRWQLEGERAIRASGVPEYVIVRPGALTDGPPDYDGGDLLVGRAEERPTEEGASTRVSRAAVADVVTAAARGEAAPNTTVSLAFAKAGTKAGGSGAAASDWRSRLRSMASDSFPLPTRPYRLAMALWGTAVACLAGAALCLLLSKALALANCLLAGVCQHSVLMPVVPGRR